MVQIELITELTKKSRGAQISLLKFTDKEITSLLENIAKKLLKTSTNKLLSEKAVLETKFGNVEDKIKKNLYKTKNLLKELKKVKTITPIFNKKKKSYEILKPIGLVCGVTPSTNPIATCLNYIINSLKTRNSIIICPNPRSYSISHELVYTIKNILLNNKFDPNLVNIAPREILRENGIIDLFNLVDKSFVTGNKNIINKARQSYKPVITFGTGNVPIIISKDADLIFASKSIIESKSFDNSTSCSADSVLIIHNNIYSKMIDKLKDQNLYLLNKEEKSKINEIYFYKGIINHKLVGKNANKILSYINPKNKKTNSKVIGYEIKKFDKNHFIFNEKLMPIIGLISYNKIEEAIEIAEKMLSVNGLGHSLGIYSKNKKQILQVSSKVKVSRIIVNQPHSQSAGGSKNNCLPTTLSLGCGPWAESTISHNLNYYDFCNVTKVVL